MDIPTNRLYISDCADFMQGMDEGTVDLTVTSPPYDNIRDYKGYTFDFEAIANQLYRVTKDGGVVVWVVSDQTKNYSESGTSFRQALYFMEIGFCLFDTMIYQKPPMGIVGGTFTYFQAFEYMFVLSKGKPKTTNFLCDRPNKWIRDSQNVTRRQKDGTTRKDTTPPTKEFGRRLNLWLYDSGFMKTTKDVHAYQHPAMFPEKLAADHILSWSNPGDLVFDPMCGSGTVCKMAEVHKRRYLGVDISADYIEIARKRMTNVQWALMT